MGERKRQLSQAVLSDHRDQDEPPAVTGGKKGGKGKDSNKANSKEDKEEITLISQILSKALLRHSVTSSSGDN